MTAFTSMTRSLPARDERRAGQDWYTDEPTNTFAVYRSWQPRWAPGMNALAV
jgi:hypothetical protein